MPLAIEQIASAALPAPVRRQLYALCAEAYGEDLTHYFADIGLGIHLLGWHQDRLVSHAMWVSRTLYHGSDQRLNAAYVELVATRATDRRRGFATQLMRQLQRAIHTYDVGALAPSDPMFYERLGWELWRGPLMVRTSSGVEATSDETVMILRLPTAPRNLDLDGALTVDWRPGEVW
jgi:aminoglycoside 2'-N-acetyltransferase I